MLEPKPIVTAPDPIPTTMIRVTRQIRPTSSSRESAEPWSGVKAILADTATMRSTSASATATE